MQNVLDSGNIELFSTCPSSRRVGKKPYLQRVADVARWSEEAGCSGILVYADNSLVDPWLVSQVIIQSTRLLCPLVAVQPIYMHPYTVAKIVTSMGYLYGRRVHLNIVAGGFKNDLIALNDTTPHDRRYQRLIEYATIIKRLLTGTRAVSYKGEFYKVDRLRLSPSPKQKLFPRIFVSGSSEAGLAAAKAIGATAVEYPKPLKECTDDVPSGTVGASVRIGIVSRERSEEAWAAAHERFPEDRKGQLTHQLAMKVSDSVWHKQLSEMGKVQEDNLYWLVPFQNYKTFCPYLVGDYERVGRELAGYISLGYRTFILDEPPDAEELRHIGKAFSAAAEMSICRSYSTAG